jgi:8-oxo-dGTP diphosphatase
MTIHAVLAVSAAIFRDDQVLLVQRATEPAKGRWTLPGGRVEIGETLIAAVTREIVEETSLTIRVKGLAGYREVILGEPAAGNGRHIVILPFAAEWISGEVKLNEELGDFRWCAIDAISDLPTTDGLIEILRQAHALIAKP